MATFMPPLLPHPFFIRAAYPMGLPEYDIIRIIIEGSEDVTGTAASVDYLEADSTELWWAGKEFLRGQVLLSLRCARTLVF
jgi:hypothetical protein